MKTKKILAISIVALLVLGVGIWMTMAAKTEDTDVKESSEEYSPDELQDMYRKYNITENDIKFAMSELPHYLEGTILHGDTRIIATETGEPPEGLKEGEYYDIVRVHYTFLTG